MFFLVSVIALLVISSAQQNDDIRDGVCRVYNIYYRIKDSCNSYVECNKAMPTPECKHQYGFFASPLASRFDCGKYRMCVEGKPLEMECSIGLAFNPESGRCVWPELVPFCDTEDSNFIFCNSIQGSCHYFFSYIQGVVRLQLCETDYAFA